MRLGGSRAFYLELAARGVCLRTGRPPDSMPPREAGELLGRVRADKKALREVLMDRRDPDVRAMGQEGGTA
ncbi:MAG: hypothetical protein M3R38_28960 [Actinomycetota bacterium]|nr:hypothetical protein [Actinomycetota bacterium]PLS86387.1 MAG: hypothetical protein CYG60_07490 [Actinomycetota bacterium]